MKSFTYSVKDKTGKITTGTTEGDDKDTVVRTLLDQGLTPVAVKLNSKFSFSSFFSFLKHVPLKDKVMFAQELSTLINAGVPISQSLLILQDQTKNKLLHEAIADLAKEVDGGLSLSGAMEKHPEIFSSIFVNMVKAGEIGGTLDEALNRLADQLEKDSELIAKIKGAMTYPIVLSIAMTGAVIYLMLTIVPELAKMFKELGGDLPASTKSLIFISNALTKYLFVTIIAVGAFIYTFRYIEKNVIPFRRMMHKAFIAMPIIGNITVKMNVAHFTRTLASLLNSGVSVVESLTIVADSTQNLIFKEAIEKTAEKVKNGVQIAEVIKTYKCFPAIVPQMISVGEATGSLDKILMKIADFYDKEVDNITKNLSTLLEPVMMIFIGVIVGYVIISIITPIYSMTNMF